MEARVNIITLGVHDLGRSSDFYQHGLGFPKLDLPGEISFFTLRGTWLALYPWEKLAEDAGVSAVSKGFRGVTLAHTVSNEQEVDALFDKIMQLGASMIKRPQKAHWGGYSGYFADFDEHLWEIAYNPYMWPGPK